MQVNEQRRNALRKSKGAQKDSETSLSSPWHILMRIPRCIRVQGREVDIVKAHNEVLESHSEVAFAKFGRGASRNRLELLNQQILNKQATHLCVVFHHLGNFDAFAAPIADILMNNQLPARRITPTFYAQETNKVGLWLILRGSFEVADISDLYLPRCGTSAIEMLSKCRTALMYVKSHTSQVGASQAKRAKT